MKAFVNTIMTKDELVKELKWHREQDSFMQGTYEREDENGKFKGCAVGCSLESLSRRKNIPISLLDHRTYEEAFGIPEWYAELIDVIFEGVSTKDSSDWAVNSIEVIPIGADINDIKSPFLIFALEEVLTTFNHNEFPKVKTAIDRIIELHENSGAFGEFSDAAARATGYAAKAAARAAEYAAASTSRVNTKTTYERVIKKFADKIIELLKGLE